MGGFEGAIDFDKEGVVQPHKKVLLTHNVSDSLMGDEFLKEYLHRIDLATRYVLDLVHLCKSTLSQLAQDDEI